jgi:hypothetical protein
MWSTHRVRDRNNEQEKGMPEGVTFTGYLANLFLSPAKKKSSAPQQATVENTPALDIGQLQALMTQQQTAIDEINLLLVTGQP